MRQRAAPKKLAEFLCTIPICNGSKNEEIGTAAYRDLPVFFNISRQKHHLPALHSFRRRLIYHFKCCVLYLLAYYSNHVHLLHK